MPSFRLELFVGKSSAACQARRTSAAVSLEGRQAAPGRGIAPPREADNRTGRLGPELDTLRNIPRRGRPGRSGPEARRHHSPTPGCAAGAGFYPSLATRRSFLEYAWIRQ